MIISHKYKFIFFALPKTGTHSIRFALRPHLGENDEEHVALFHNSKFDIQEFETRNNGHFSVKEILPHLSEEVWNTYYKFTFVRNPWDRFVSAVVFKNKQLQNRTEFVSPFIDKFIHKPNFIDNIFYKPQYDYLTDNNGKQCMDFIGKTENMEADYHKICNHLGIPIEKIDVRNSTSRKGYQDILSPESKIKIEEIYKNDVEHFSYSF
jgi:hypothetical protein